MTKFQIDNLPNFDDLWKEVKALARAKVEEWRNLPTTPGFKEALNKIKLYELSHRGNSRRRGR